MMQEFTKGLTENIFLVLISIPPKNKKARALVRQNICFTVKSNLRNRGCFHLYSYLSFYVIYITKPQKMSLSSHKCVHTRNVHSRLHQLSHRTHLSIHPSISHPHGSSRTRAFPAGHWCHYGYHRATEKAHGGSWCLADWFLICGEEMVHLRH